VPGDGPGTGQTGSSSAALSPGHTRAGALTRLAMNDLATASQLVDELAACADEDWLMPRVIPSILPSSGKVCALLWTMCSTTWRALFKSQKKRRPARRGPDARLAGDGAAGDRVGRASPCALARALAIAEPEGYVRSFIDEGAPMGELLAAILARGGPAGRRSRRGWRAM